jgi:hypothetical protein
MKSAPGKLWDDERMRKLFIGGLFVMMLLNAFSLASADCITAQRKTADALAQSDLVFSGIVTKVDSDDRLGFRVERVWKGPIRREMWIHQLETPTVGTYTFHPNPEVKYIVFANELADSERSLRLRGDEQIAFGIGRFCGAGPLWSRAQERELDRIARGRKPR